MMNKFIVVVMIFKVLMVIVIMYEVIIKNVNENENKMY